jgi:heme exporter protein A
VLSVQNVNKQFGYRPVLRDVSLEIKDGELLGLVGPNGSGKSTLLRIVVRVVSCDGGSIPWNGNSILNTGADQRRPLLYIGHEPGFYPPLSAAENLHLIAKLYGLEPSAEDVEKNLYEVGLDPARTGPIREFSRGMLQRLTLSKALTIPWELLLLDEPTTGLDGQGKSMLSQLTETWRKKDRSLLLVSHDEEWLSSRCDRVVQLSNGRIQRSEADREKSVQAELTGEA